jgi:hypothetical protein
MAYSFELLGVTPLLDFFNYQQKNEQNPHRPKAYVGSYVCTLDSFIDAMDMIPKKPEWNWDEVVESMVKFWIQHEETIRLCELELTENKQEEPQLVIGRVANLEALRHEFEYLFEA